MDIDKESALEAIQDPARDASQRREALSWLLGKKALKDQEAALTAALSAWEKTATQDSARPFDRLIAVSELVRIGSANPSLSALSTDLLKSVLVKPLPDTVAELDGDGRINISKALRVATPDWASQYALSMLATEDKSDRVRTELIELLTDTQTNLAEILSGLASAFEDEPTGGAASVKAHTRRAARILEVLRSAFAVSEIEAGKDAGSSLDQLLRMAIRVHGKDVDRKSAEDIAEQVIRFVQTMLRSRFSLSLEPETYAAIKRASGMFARGSWPKSMTGSLRGLERDILEAVVLLGRQGIENKDLLDQLTIVSGSRDQARALTKQLVEAHPELPESVKFFLTHWQVRLGENRDSDDVQEAALSKVDNAIADALVGTEKWEKILRDETDPSQHAHAVRAMTNSITEIAKRRRIAFWGEEGRTMKASAKYFQSESASADGVVIRRAVVQLRADGTPGACLIKGILS